MTPRVRRREALGLLVCASSLGLLALNRPDEGAPQPQGVRAAAASDATPRASGSGPVTVAADRRPARVRVGDIDLDEPVRALGLSAAADISPPVGVVQWYTGSVAPGQRGVAVLAGHVTSPKPDVFHRLDELAVGDLVRVSDGADVSRTFAVERTARVDKQVLTRDRSVWGPTDRRMVALITCDDQSAVADGHYRGNVVVWAELVA